MLGPELYDKNHFPLPIAPTVNMIPAFMAEQETTTPTPNPFDEPRIVPDPEDLFATYKTQIITVAALLLLALLGAGAWGFWKQNREEEAMKSFREAGSIEDWKNLSDAMPNTAGGGFALIELAEASKQAGDWEQAISAYGTFLQYHSKNPLAPSAELGLARSLEGQEDWTAAQDAYLSIISASPPHPFSAPAHLGLARVYLAQDQTDAARQILADLLASTRQSPYAGQAEQMLKNL